MTCDIARGDTGELQITCLLYYKCGINDYLSVCQTLKRKELMKRVVDNNFSMMYCSAIQMIKAQQAYSKTDITMSHLVASLNRKVIIH